ncbi:MAG: FG-GAP repeat domain-containing protein [Isosphaeraceae bacterium]
MPIGPEASLEQVERTCGTCHAYPPPDLFPKDLWPHEVSRGFSFLRGGSAGSAPAGTPSFASVVAHYRRRAPESLPVLEPTVPPHECPVRFERNGYRPSGELPSPGVANVRFVHLSDERKLDVLACDMMNGKVFLLKPYEPAAELRVVSDAIAHPAHAEVADLNADGIKDILVANLGSPMPTEEPVGSVVWLEGRPDGSFAPTTLADGLGRVADVQAADFDGDGDLDLVVAEFGWLKTGRIVLLENRTTDPGRPVFVASTIDPRHGAIHVPVADLNGDGRPDFVALISQEHEKVVAFLNAGDHRFVPQVIYAAPHPAFGSSGIQLVDLDGDGDRDVLMSNGDTMDSQLLRPYHGVQWLENRGSYPFVYHRLTSLYAAQRAVANDLDGDGDLDIVAVCFLPGNYYRGLCREMDLDAIVVLEQAEPGQFVRHTLETVTCNHATCDVGDFDADGKMDLVTGNLMISFGPIPIEDQPDADWVVIRKNLGRPSPGGGSE